MSRVFSKFSEVLRFLQNIISFHPQTSPPKLWIIFVDNVDNFVDNYKTSKNRMFLPWIRSFLSFSFSTLFLLISFSVKIFSVFLYKLHNFVGYIMHYSWSSINIIMKMHNAAPISSGMEKIHLHGAPFSGTSSVSSLPTLLRKVIFVHENICRICS